MKILNKKGDVEWDYTVYIILFLVIVLIGIIIIFFAKDIIMELGKKFFSKIWIFE